MQLDPDDTDRVVWLSIPVSPETAARLSNLADICHADPKKVAASLLHDLLKDDEEAHALEAIPVAGHA